MKETRWLQSVPEGYMGQIDMGSLRGHTGFAYPFTVTEDKNPKGGAWLFPGGKAHISRVRLFQLLRGLALRAGLDPEQAEALLEGVRVAARWNDGFGRVAYYYPTDLDAALASAQKD